MKFQYMIALFIVSILPNYVEATGTWQQVFDSTADTSHVYRLNKVVYANSRFIAVGQIANTTNNSSASGNFKPLIMSSTDGMNWSNITPELGLNAGSLTDLIYVNNQFVAVGNYNTSATNYNNRALVLTSPEGASWTQKISINVTGDQLLGAETIAYGAGRYITNRRGSVYYSSNLINWTIATVDASPNGWDQFTFANDLFIGVGSGDFSKIRISSTDGASWQDISTAGNPIGGFDLKVINGIFYNTARENGISGSPTASGWQDLTPALFNQSALGIDYANQTFIIGGGHPGSSGNFSGYITISDNLNSWWSQKLNSFLEGGVISIDHDSLGVVGITNLGHIYYSAYSSAINGAGLGLGGVVSATLNQSFSHSFTTTNISPNNYLAYRLEENSNALNSSGSGLPAGLSLDSSAGVISGTPTEAGTYRIGVLAQDTSNGDGSRDAGGVFTLIVGESDSDGGTGGSQWTDSYGKSGSLSVADSVLTGSLFGSFVGELSSVTGGILFIGWWQDGSNSACGPGNAHAGPIKLLFNNSGTSFTGSFSTCLATDGNPVSHDQLSETSSLYTGSVSSGSLDFTSVLAAGNGNSVPAVNSFLVITGESTQSATTSTPWSTSTITLTLDPAQLQWLGWSQQETLKAYDGNVNSRTGEGVIVGGIDDSLDVTVTNPDGASLTVRFNDNTAFGNTVTSVPQNIFYGTEAAAPDAFSVSPAYGSPPSQEALLDEAGPFNSLFTGAGNYSFRFDFINVYTSAASRPNVYILTDGPATVVTETGSNGSNNNPDLSEISSKANLDWSNANTVGFTWSTPIVLDDRVILQDQDGGLDAFSVSDGSKIFYKDLANAFPTNSPIFSNGFIYMIAGDLLKVDPADGSMLASFSEASISSQSPATYKELIYVGGSSLVYALDINTLQLVWSRPVSGGSVNVAVKDDVLYVFANGLTAFDATSGSQLWTLAPPGGGALTIGSLSGNYLSVFESSFSSSVLHLYQLGSTPNTSPSLLWSADMGNNSADNAPPAMDLNNVYAASREGVLRGFALNGNGTPLWTETVRSNGMAPALPMASGGVVFIQQQQSDGSYQLVALNGTSGAQIAITSITGMGISWGSPVKKKGVVYIATDHGGTLYSIDFDSNIGGDWEMIKGNAQLTGNSVAGLISEVDAATLTINLPQLYVPGIGVFATELTLLDAVALRFNLNAANASTANVSSSSIATFDTQTQILTIPRMFYQGILYSVTFGLTGASGNNYEFTLLGAE